MEGTDGIWIPLIPADILDDLSSRFIINVPEEERKDLIRICFQIELANWFYLDFYCVEESWLRPCSMKEFTKLIFHHIPFLREHADRVDSILEDWRAYKMAVPTYGAILLDAEMENVLLVQGYWAKCSWGFPKGKVNKEEEAHHCAVREVLEETGFDISKLIKKELFLDNNIRDQQVRLYIVSGVPRDIQFKPKTRNEIKCVEWFSISDLPSHKKDMAPKTSLNLAPKNFFTVMPFVRPLRQWIVVNQRKPAQGSSRRGNRSKSHSDASTTNGQSNEKGKKQQQQHFAQMCQSEYELLKGKEVHSATKNVYSPPPRLQKSKNQQENSARKQITQPTSTLPSSGASPRSKRSLMFQFTAAAEQDKKQKSSNGLLFSASAWSNFHLDKEALMAACFADW